MCRRARTARRRTERWAAGRRCRDKLRPPSHVERSPHMALPSPSYTITLRVEVPASQRATST
ncbi:hypothetical protein GB881_14645, partial [Georgenia subflava]|nr:hypothetical protein [Georgenia subflava]